MKYLIITVSEVEGNDITDARMLQNLGRTKILDQSFYKVSKVMDTGKVPKVFKDIMMFSRGIVSKEG